MPDNLLLPVLCLWDADRARTNARTSLQKRNKETKMPYYWDAFLGKLQEQGINLADITPRQLLERYHNWLKREEAAVCEREWTQPGTSGTGNAPAANADISDTAPPAASNARKP